MSNKKLMNRAFIVQVQLGGFLNRKVKSIKISDGLNSITISPFDYFVIDTDKPMNEAIIRVEKQRR